jgi:hypothetical protein
VGGWCKLGSETFVSGRVSCIGALVVRGGFARPLPVISCVYDIGNYADSTLFCTLRAWCYSPFRLLGR